MLDDNNLRMKKTVFLIMTAIFACLISHEIRIHI